jgi:hypothetical protein
MVSYTKRNQSNYNYEDNLIHSYFITGGSLQFRADAHYHFFKKLYGVFSFNTSVLEIGVHDRIISQNRFFGTVSYETGVKVTPPFVGCINANLALGVRI